MVKDDCDNWLDVAGYFVQLISIWMHFFHVLKKGYTTHPNDFISNKEEVESPPHLTSFHSVTSQDSQITVGVACLMV